MSHFLDNLIAFGRLLRDAGLPIGTDRLITLTNALPLIDLGSRADVHAACRAVLIQRHEDLAAFDVLFDAFWTQQAAAGPSSSGPRLAPNQTAEGVAAASDALSQGELLDEPVPLRSWSDRETIADKDFAQLTAAERSMVRSALSRLTWNLPERRTRRWVTGRGRRIHMRQALAKSLRSGGEITSWPTRHRATRPRPIVLLCDVSGSMEPYTRTLLLFAHTLSRSTRDVEAFLFATRLTRITHELRGATPDAAMAAVSRAVRDWSGGTRIGDALRTFHQRWRRRTLRGHAIVILISDGWDRGEPQVLRDEIARLQRSCHRLVWLNPLIGTIDYAPLTRGLEASLPFVDDFLPVRTLRDVRDLALHLSAIGSHGHHRVVHLRSAARTRLGADARSGGDRILHPGM